MLRYKFALQQTDEKTEGRTDGRTDIVSLSSPIDIDSKYLYKV